jgi:hypothetical protein
MSCDGSGHPGEEYSHGRERARAIARADADAEPVRENARLRAIVANYEKRIVELQTLTELLQNENRTLKHSLERFEDLHIPKRLR